MVGKGDAVHEGRSNEQAIGPPAFLRVLLRPPPLPDEKQQEEQRHQGEMEHVRVGIGRQPPEDRCRRESGGGERDPHRREPGHDQEQETGGQGDPAHPRQELDDGDRAGDGPGGEKGLEQVHPVCRVGEGQHVRRDEAQDHVRRIACRMGRPKHRRDRLELGRVPTGGAGEQAGGERGDDEPERRNGSDQRREGRHHQIAIQAGALESTQDRLGSTGRRGRLRRAVGPRQNVTSQASLPRRCPTG